MALICWHSMVLFPANRGNLMVRPMSFHNLFAYALYMVGHTHSTDRGVSDIAYRLDMQGCIEP